MVTVATPSPAYHYVETAFRTVGLLQLRQILSHLALKSSNISFCELHLVLHYGELFQFSLVNIGKFY